VSTSVILLIINGKKTEYERDFADKSLEKKDTTFLTEKFLIMTFQISTLKKNIATKY